MSLYGTILRSADGDRWTEAADTGTVGSFHGVASDGSQFVAVGDVVVHSALVPAARPPATLP